jgi:hypothetical protein
MALWFRYVVDGGLRISRGVSMVLSGLCFHLRGRSFITRTLRAVLMTWGGSAMVHGCAFREANDDSGGSADAGADLPESPILSGDTGTGTPECEVFDLSLWCFNSISVGGPSNATGTCPIVGVDTLMVDPYAWHGRCESSYGSIDFVNEANPYGGPSWYFGATGELIAYTYTTDTNAFCDGKAFHVAYGFDPNCESYCVLADPHGVSNSFGVVPPC